MTGVRSCSEVNENGSIWAERDTAVYERSAVVGCDGTGWSRLNRKWWACHDGVSACSLGVSLQDDG